MLRISIDDKRAWITDLCEGCERSSTRSIGYSFFCSFSFYSFFHWWKKKQKNLEGIKGIALRAPLAPVATCSIFSQAKNALPLGASLFLKFLRFCPELASGCVLSPVSWLLFPKKYPSILRQTQGRLSSPFDRLRVTEGFFASLWIGLSVKKRYSIPF